MFAFHQSQFTEAANAALLQAATQNVLGAFCGSADELFSDVLAVLCSTLSCTSAGARLMDGRRLDRQGRPGPPQTTAALEELITHVVREAQPFVGSIVNGEAAAVSFAGAPLLDRSGSATGCLYAIAPEGRTFTSDDLEVLARFARIGSREFDLIAATYTDPATGSMSQWAFDALLHRSSTQRASRTVAAIGIDGLDAIVDTHSRGASDLILRSVAQICRDTLRRTDLIARLGSPRLVALLSDATPEVTLRCMERVRAAAEELIMPELQGVRISLSIGYTGSNEADLMSRVADAEKASYAAARMGGNRCLSVNDLRAALRVFRDRRA